MNKPLWSFFFLAAAFMLTVTLLTVLVAMDPDPAFSGGFDSLTVRIPANPLSPYPREQDTTLAVGKFLVASRDMKDPRFAEAVIFLVGYSSEGAMGLVINRPSHARLSRAFPELEGLKKSKDLLYIGGPVRIDQVFMLVRSIRKPDDSRHVFSDVYVSGNRTLLRKMIDKGESGKRFRVFAGYAGWTAGQLDREVALGGWYVMPADAETIFEKKPSHIWPELIRRSSLTWVGEEGVSSSPMSQRF